MFKRLKKLLIGKNENSVLFRRDMAARLSGKKIKYVTERRGDDDYVIGREGALICRDGELLVFSSADIVFRAEIDKLQMSELLSLGGVILSGPDLTRDGEERTIIAYYTYYVNIK